MGQANYMAAKAGFAMGRLLATPGALKALEEAGQAPFRLLVRHQSGDWGDLSEADRRLNDEALVHKTRLFSAYRLKTGVKVWVITEADRCATTFLLPSEY